MIKREAEEKLKELAAGFPAVSVTGPRQSGKTTLVRSVFPEKPYVLLEDLDIRAYAKEDPRSFLGQYTDTGAVIDEIQHVPELFSWLQGILDSSKEPGRFILTGSQNFMLSEKISQSLAGRVGILKLLPLSISEIKNAGLAKKSYEDYLFTGFYPRIYDNDINAADYYSSYIQTYIERDLRQLKQIKDLFLFQDFLKMCANRNGQVVNFSSLANDCGITDKTAKEWLSLLQASFTVFLTRTHHKNFNKRLTKMPKLYFTDPGLASNLAGIQSPEQLNYHPLKGGLFESMIAGELLKFRFNRSRDNNLYYWRDKSGHEIDCIIDTGQNNPVPVEIKAGRTISTDYFKNISYWNNLSGNPPERSFVVYGGEKSQNRKAGRVISYDDIGELTGYL
jgi:predicted AAA+ superfamily ATPase